MAVCIQHNFRRCTGLEKATCEDCCAASAECGNYWYQPLVGSANNLQIGDKLWLTSECEGEAAPAGIYTDCGPEGSCTQPAGETRIYGCVTIDASSLVTAITACTGTVSCGSGPGDGPETGCSQSGALDTNTKHTWAGRQLTKVAVVNTWETLYETPTSINITNTSVSDICYTDAIVTNPVYLKQIYIHNCDNGSTNEKKFSVRLYNAEVGTMTTSECNIVFNTIPAELIIADRIKLTDNQRVKLLEFESPLKMNHKDLIQIQSHTSVDGFVIGAWIETGSQHYDEPPPQIENQSFNEAGANSIANMAGLSRKLGKRQMNKRQKPGAASTSGDG
jgi:hypothetical protein